MRVDFIVKRNDVMIRLYEKHCLGLTGTADSLKWVLTNKFHKLCTKYLFIYARYSIFVSAGLRTAILNRASKNTLVFH